MAKITEWEFVGDVSNWITQSLTHDPELPFSPPKLESRSEGTTKRRDLTLLDKNHRIVLTGEVKLPFQPNGGSPFNESLIQDARKKAQRANSKFFFTWNVNTFVLWETAPAGSNWREQNYRLWEITSVHTDNQMLLPTTISAVQDWLPRFLYTFSNIYLGEVALGTKSPDERFIETLETFLQRPILLTIDTLRERYAKPRFKADLDKWMREDQGWVIYDDFEGIRENLERASKFACYALLNKLVFHETLLKRYKQKLTKLAVPKHISTGENLRSHLEKFFAVAKEITGDYETVFGEEHLGIGNRIPFYSDKAVPHWRDLIDQIHRFDFSKLDYEVIGAIFERLISPEERHKYGQFYTRVEVVDLINSFCIRNGDEQVMDPACGGGTFLVRAYVRKRELLPETQHGQLLKHLYGVDNSHFATHLTTINLATRDLVPEGNYPQIVRSDFFDVQADKVFVTLPRHLESAGTGKSHRRQVIIPKLDAVIGNPPYVRQEGIRKAKKTKKTEIQRGTKEHYQQLVKAETGASLSGRSDLHCYFWPHATTFLKDDGYLCFLTSSQWLDVEYGFRLQEWVLRNFEIHAIFESIDEPWFVGARVATAVTILRRQKDEQSRMNSVVRFVQLRRPMKEILAHDGTGSGAVVAANEFRDEILTITENTANQRYRIRLVKQSDLWQDGVQLGKLMGKAADKDETEESTSTGKYYGGKWGMYLRAPDLWFNFLDRFSSKLVPLGEIAEIRRGITSGKDDFFFPKDCSNQCLTSHPDPDDFEDTYGLPRKDVKSGRVKLVRCGEGLGEVRPIESKYLEPEVHSLMEVDGFTVSKEDCARFVLLVSEAPSKLKGTYLLKYIRWGERIGYHKGSTCKSRASADRLWYDLTGHDRGGIFWPMTQKYKHAVPLNSDNLICNHNLFDLNGKNISDVLLAGILNSSWVVLSKFQFGRFAGTEGTLKTEVIDVNMMLVPDPRGASKTASERVGKAFEVLKQRKAFQMLSERRLRQAGLTEAGKSAELKSLSDIGELDMDDRFELDDAVAELMGEKSKRKREELISELYRELYMLFERHRDVEEKTNLNKRASRSRGPARPLDIAQQILEEVKETYPHLIRRWDPGFIDMSKPYDTYDLPAEGKPERHSDFFVPNGTRFTKGKNTSVGLVATQGSFQDDLLILLVESGERGLVRVPHEAEECRRIMKIYGKFVRERDKVLRELIEARTSDEDLQDKIYETLLPLIFSIIR